ncbi:MAG: RHS repeat protein, partial [bacterium]|nr:RHS repeat protein [bacterium]
QGVSTASSCSSCSGGGSSQPSRIVYPTFIKEFRYDAQGRKIEERDIPDGGTDASQRVSTFAYDAVGNLTTQTDAKGQTTSYAYDALNRLSRVTDAAGSTSYSYNVLGNLTLLSDAENQRTRFRYDRSGRLVAEIRPLGQQTSYEYDPAGNLIEKKDAKLQATSYAYDDAGRLTQLQSADTSVSFSYDNTGNLTAYDDGVTSGSYGYNALNQKLTETVNYGGFTKSFSYSYAANGQKTSFTMPDGTLYEYAYGDNNELRSISLPGTGQIGYPSYTWTRPDAIVYPGGARQEYSYDPLMRVTQILAKDPGGNSVLDYSYTYDTVGNILSKQTERGSYNYTYDAISRLTDVQVDVPGEDNEGFDYDAVGNRVAQEGVEGEWSYNDNNELLSFADTEYKYDANGNAVQLLFDGAVMFTYHYNAQDRLVKVDDVNGNTVSEYFYDPFGRRLWKEVSGTKTYFFYSDEGLVAEYDATGNEVRAYGYRPDSTWTTDPLWLKQGTEYHFYQNDHLGTPQKLVKQNGAVVWSAGYSAFGQATVEVSTVKNNLRFPGQYFDAETGLHYNFHR